MFGNIVKDQTKGKDAIWFVSPENQQFRANLRLTMLANLILYPCLLIPVWEF